MKIIILVLSVEGNKLYDSFYKAQKETWDSIEIDNIETYYFYGGETENLNGNYIYTGIEEKLWVDGSPLSAGLKTIKAFEMLSSKNYDYILRTNLSSYIDKEQIYKYLLDKPRENYYSGFIGFENKDIYGNITDDIKYASGSGIIISSDIVKFLIDHNDEIEHNRFIDDAAIGKILNEYNIYPEPLTRLDNIDDDGFFYRLKSNDRNIDIANMYKIYEKKIKL